MIGMAEWMRVARASEIPEGEMKAVRLGDREIALYHTDDGEFYATDNICTHEFAQLAEGWLEGWEVECPLHAGRFDVRTGKALCAPVQTDLQTFEVKVEGDDVLVKAE
jgi:NAD(P)H-dependent nitrite reductase small subunit